MEKKSKKKEGKDTEKSEYNFFSENISEVDRWVRSIQKVKLDVEEKEKLRLEREMRILDRRMKKQ